MAVRLTSVMEEPRTKETILEVMLGTRCSQQISDNLIDREDPSMIGMNSEYHCFLDLHRIS